MGQHGLLLALCMVVWDGSVGTEPPTAFTRYSMQQSCMRRYYVVFEDGEWKVMLENGPNLRSFKTKQPAVEHAKKLGRRNDRPVMVNYKDGRTGQQYFDYAEK